MRFYETLLIWPRTLPCNNNKIQWPLLYDHKIPRKEDQIMKHKKMKDLSVAFVQCNNTQENYGTSISQPTETQTAFQSSKDRTLHFIEGNLLLRIFISVLQFNVQCIKWLLKIINSSKFQAMKTSRGNKIQTFKINIVCSKLP